MSRMSDAELSKKIDAVVKADTEDFVALLEIAGLDPKKDLAGGDWQGIDFGQADLSGWNLRAARLSYANLSKVRNVELARFDLETELKHVQLPPGVSVKGLVPSAKTPTQWLEGTGIEVDKSVWEKSGISFNEPMTRRDFNDLGMSKRVFTKPQV